MQTEATWLRKKKQVTNWESNTDALRCFLGIALCILTAHDFASLARAYQRARAQTVSNFPQTKLDSDLNAPLLLNEHGDPHFLFHNFNEDNIFNNWERN